MGRVLIRYEELIIDGLACKMNADLVLLRLGCHLLVTLEEFPARCPWSRCFQKDPATANATAIATATATAASVAAAATTTTPTAAAVALGLFAAALLLLPATAAAANDTAAHASVAKRYCHSDYTATASAHATV